VFIALLLSRRLGRARRDYEQAITLNRQVNGGWTAAFSMLDLGRLCSVEGVREESSALATSRGDRVALRYAQAVLAERDLAWISAPYHAQLSP
jgi:hypothetical protein